jgi:predicted RNA polymerase sigma factor
MGDMGLGEYCQPLEDIDLERLVEQLLRLEGNAAALTAVVAEKTANNRARLGEQYDLIVGIVCGSPAKHSEP